VANNGREAPPAVKIARATLPPTCRFARFIAEGLKKKRRERGWEKEPEYGETDGDIFVRRSSSASQSRGWLRPSGPNKGRRKRKRRSGGERSDTARARRRGRERESSPIYNIYRRRPIMEFRLRYSRRGGEAAEVGGRRTASILNPRSGRMATPVVIFVANVRTRASDMIVDHFVDASCLPWNGNVTFFRREFFGSDFHEREREKEREREREREFSDRNARGKLFHSVSRAALVRVFHCICISAE